MPLNNVIRDKQFFQDLRDSDITMRANDFDNQFNQVVNYINNSLITFIDGIAGGAAAGVVGQPNTFLRNIGDGTTDWAAVNSDAFQDYTIEFSKIAQATAPCTILASGPNQIFTQVSSNNTNEVLISQNNDVPIWSKVRTTHLENRGISGIKIGLQAIANEHLQPGILINNLANNSLVNRNFVNNAVSTQKLALGQLNSDTLGIIPLTGYNIAAKFADLIRLNHMKLNTITADKIKDDTIYPQHFNRVKIVTAGKFGPSSIRDNFPYAGSGPPANDFRGFFTSSMLSPNFALTGRELELNTFAKNFFEPTVTQAFTDKGC
jgi:hypothetical protein